MSKSGIFERFDEDQQKDYERMARLQYGPDIVNESIQRWNRRSKGEQEHILAEAGQVYSDLVQALEMGEPPQSAHVQTIYQRWHDNLRHFYEPTLDIMRGLAYGYHSDPAFIANFQRLHPDLPEYLHDGITQYVDDLEYAEIVRMLSEDEASRQS